MPNISEETLKFRMANRLANQGVQIITKNRSRRVNSLFTHGVFCIILLAIFFFKPSESNDLGRLTPFVMPFLLFFGSLGSLMFHRVITDSDFQGYCFLEEAAWIGKQLKEPHVSGEFSAAAKHHWNIERLKQVSYTHIGVTVLISGLSALLGLWDTNWFTILWIGCCFIVLGLLFGLLFHRDYSSLNKAIAKASCQNPS